MKLILNYLPFSSKYFTFLFLLFGVSIMQAQKNKPTQAQAEQLVNQVFKFFQSNDSIGFKNLFIKDTTVNLESDVVESFHNKMIYTNFYEIKNHLNTEIKENTKFNNVRLITYAYKKANNKKKNYIYRIEANILNSQGLKKVLDFQALFQSNTFRLVNSIAYNEVIESKD